MFLVEGYRAHIILRTVSDYYIQEPDQRRHLANNIILNQRQYLANNIILNQRRH